MRFLQQRWRGLTQMTLSLRQGLALAAAIGVVVALPTPAAAQGTPTLSVGAGTVLLAPRKGDKPPPAAPLRTEAMMKQAVPTSQWYSTIAFNANPGPVFAHLIEIDWALVSHDVFHSGPIICSGRTTRSNVSAST